jgi:hypothetical protein
MTANLFFQLFITAKTGEKQKDFPAGTAKGSPATMSGDSENESGQAKPSSPERGIGRK